MRLLKQRSHELGLQQRLATAAGEAAVGRLQVRQNAPNLCVRESWVWAHNYGRGMWGGDRRIQ